MDDNTTADLRVILPDPNEIDRVTRAYEGLARAERNAGNAAQNVNPPSVPRVAGPYSNHARA